LSEFFLLLCIFRQRSLFHLRRLLSYCLYLSVFVFLKTLASATSVSVAPLCGFHSLSTNVFFRLSKPRSHPFISSRFCFL
jgi:hypothetical protein